MKKLLIWLGVIALCIFGITQCKSENYSNGERVGLVTQFNEEGVLWKTWEGELNVTQTGMNSTGEPFTFSIDRKNKMRVDNDAITSTLQQALVEGWIVKLTYRKVWGAVNFFRNRGETAYFIDKVEILRTTTPTPNDRLNVQIYE